VGVGLLALVKLLPYLLAIYVVLFLVRLLRGRSVKK